MAKAKAKVIEQIPEVVQTEEGNISPLSKKSIYQKEILTQYIDEQGFVVVQDVERTLYKLPLEQYQALKQ